MANSSQVVCAFLHKLRNMRKSEKKIIVYSNSFIDNWGMSKLIKSILKVCGELFKVWTTIDSFEFHTIFDYYLTLDNLGIQIAFSSGMFAWKFKNKSEKNTMLSISIINSFNSIPLIICCCSFPSSTFCLRIC